MADDRIVLRGLGRLFMTHDLSCATGNLVREARRHAQQADAIFRPETRSLAIAAIAFTIQLAIEEGHDPAQMRALERELMTVLRVPEDASAP